MYNIDSTFKLYQQHFALDAAAIEEAINIGEIESEIGFEITDEVLDELEAEFGSIQFLMKSKSIDELAHIIIALLRRINSIRNDKKQVERMKKGRSKKSNKKGFLYITMAAAFSDFSYHVAKFLSEYLMMHLQSDNDNIMSPSP